MAEFQVKYRAPGSLNLMTDDLQDVESLQTAIEAIVQGKNTQSSLAQLYPVLDTSPFTPSLVRLMLITSVTGTNMRYIGSSGGYAALDTIPLHPCRPDYQGGIGKDERQGDLDRSARDPGTPNSCRRTRR